ncbi:hypothetical protein L7F22_058103 [Adiantum nelumboides]|nr:hypothetical protein [Adiantum nelumboides]
MKQAGTIPTQGDLGTKGILVDALSMSNAAEESLGARFDHLISEAIMNLQDPNGGSKGRIASYLESHYPVPSNFRRLLAAKLKLLTQQGKLTKIRRHYSMARDLGLLNESRQRQSFEEAAVKKRAHLDYQGSEEIAMKFKGMAANEVAMIAAQAVADAEVAAAAAEEAARVAEIAEAEWEAAEAAAEMAAALATGRSRTLSVITSRRGSLAFAE